MNDTLPSLHESVRSAPELVDLVKSAADDLGVDLDHKYTPEDDSKFEAAPVERSPERSPVSRHGSAVQVMVEKLEDEEFQPPVMRKATSLASEGTHETEDVWLQKTRRQLTQLSETRSQLLDELDTITDDLGIHLDEHRGSSTYNNPIERVFNKRYTSASRKSTRLRNKSIDSVFEEVPRMIDQAIDDRRLSRVLTRISTQSRRMSMISQGMLEGEAIPAEEIQAWLECAQIELPAAIDSITAVMETLPAVNFAPGLETEEIDENEERDEYEGSEDAEEQSEYAGALATQRQSDCVEEAEEQPRHAIDLSPVLESKSVEYGGNRPESPMSVAPEQDADDIKEGFEVEEQPESSFHMVTGLETPNPEPQLEEIQSPVVRKVNTRRPAEKILSPESQLESDDLEVPVVRKATTRRPTERSPSSEVELAAKDFQTPVMRKATTRQPTERSSNSEVELAIKDFQPPFMRKVATRRQQTEQVPSPTPDLDDDDFQPPVLRKVTTRRPTEQIPSPTPDLDDDDFQPPVLRKVTTRRPTEQIPSPTPDLNDEDYQPPVLRKVTTRRPPERISGPDHVIEDDIFQHPVVRKVATRQATEAFKPALEVDDFQPPLVRKVATRRPTEKILGAEREPEVEPPVVHKATSRWPTEQVVPKSENDEFRPPVTRKTTTLAALDVYHGSPASSILGAPRDPSHAPTPSEEIRSRRQSTAEDISPIEKSVRIQDGPQSSYSPPTRVYSRQPSFSAPERSPTAPVNEAELVPNDTLAAPVTRIAERPTLPAEGIPDQEPSRLDRPPTVYLTRDPQSLTPPLERVATTAPERRQSTIPRVLTVPVEKQRKPHSAAPGIVAPPTQYVPKRMMPTTRKAKSRKSTYGVNLPPDQQRPPAPEYPVRDTPTWTKPDKHTPPPKHKEEPKTKTKRGFLGFGSRPKADSQPVSRIRREYSPEPPAQRDRGPFQPFRSAATGQTPGNPGGTLQRPRGYPTAPGREPIFLARKVAPPISVYSPPRRRDDTPPRKAPAFAKKDDYYPRLPPPPPEQQHSYSRPRAAPVRRDVYSQPPPPPAKRDDYSMPPPAPARRDVYSRPHSAPMRQDVYQPFLPAPARPGIYPRPRPARYENPPPAYRQPPPQQNYPPRNQVDARPLRSQAPEALRYQPQVQQDLRDREKVVSRREAPAPIRWAPTDEQSIRTPAVSQAATKPGPVPQDAQRDWKMDEPPQRSRTRDRTLGTGDEEVSSTQRGNVERQPSSKAASRDAGRRASPMAEVSIPRAQGQGADHSRRSSAARANQAPQAEDSSQEDFGSASEYGARDVDGDHERGHITDGTNEERSRTCIERAHTERTVRARTTMARASTFSALDAARRISAAGHALKPKPDGALLRPLSPIEAARTISAAGHCIKRHSCPNPEDFRTGSTTPRAGTPRAGISRSGTLRPESRGDSFASTAEEPSRATTAGYTSRRSSTLGEEASGTRKTSGRRPSTAHGTKSPGGTWGRQTDITRRTSGAVSSNNLPGSCGGSTLAASGPGSPLSEASSATITSESYSRDRSLEQGAQRVRTIPEAATESPRTPTPGEESGAAQSGLGYVLLQSPVSERTPDRAPAPIQQYRGSGILSGDTSRADALRSCSPATSNFELPVPEPAAADGSQLQSSAQQRTDSKRRDSFLTASSPPKSPSPTGQRSFWGRGNKSESPPRDKKNAGGKDDRRGGDVREEVISGSRQIGQDGGSQQKGFREKKTIGAKVVGGQGVSLGLGKKLLEKWGIIT
jgi:hypothetical protein